MPSPRSRTPAPPADAGVVVCARFPPAARVRARAEFALAFAEGRRVADPLLALHHRADAMAPRLGLAVSRKVDPNASGRNRIKRVLRDAFRRQRAALAGGAYVVVARPGAGSAANDALRAALQGLLIRAGALPRPIAAGTMPPAPSPPPERSA